MGLMEIALAQQLVRERSAEAERTWRRRRALADRTVEPVGPGGLPPGRGRWALLLDHLLHLRIEQLEAWEGRAAAQTGFPRGSRREVGAA